MSYELFRREVYETARTGWLGEVSLVHPVRLRVLACTAVFAALGVVLFLAFGTYTRRATVVGQLIPSHGLATVLAPVTGVVSRLDSEEGMDAASGQTLAIVSVPRATPKSGDTYSALDRQYQQRKDGLTVYRLAQIQQLMAQEHGLKSQLVIARRELAQVNVEVGTRRDQVRIASENLDRLRQLEDSRYVSALQIGQQESATLVLTSEVQALQRQATSVRGEIVRIEHLLRELPGQRQLTEGGYLREIAQLEQEQVQAESQYALAVVAPVAGVVATQMIKLGQSVQVGQPVLSMLPDEGKLEAVLLVPSRAIGFIESGDTVLLRYVAYPYEKFGHQEGRVTQISRSALASDELGVLIGSAQQGEPFYRVTVALSVQAVMAYGKAEGLKPGMLLEADVLGEKRRLIEWLLEPLYSLRGKVMAR